MIIKNFSIVFIFLQGGLSPSIFDFSGFSSMFSRECFRSHHSHFYIAHLGLIVCVALDALPMPLGSLTRWLAFLVSLFSRRLTRPLHGCSPCTLSYCGARVCPPWPNWIRCVIMCWCFLGGPYYPFPVGLILWNGDCLLIPLSGALARRWLVLVLLHDRCLIQLPTFSSQPSTIARSVEDWLWREEGIDNS